MSISRLCVRISKCSRESLSLNGERITQYTFFSVGSGTGPDTLAPVRVAVSTISFAADSIAEVSYAFRRMRILFWLADAMVSGVAALWSLCGVVCLLRSGLAACTTGRRWLPPGSVHRWGAGGEGRLREGPSHRRPARVAGLTSSYRTANARVPPRADGRACATR